MTPGLSAVLDRRSLFWIAPFFAACMMGAALALSEKPVGLVAVLAAVVAYGILGLVSIRAPLVLAAGILLSLEIFPPLYFTALGETPIFVSFLLIPLVIAVVVIRSPEIRTASDPVARGLVAFLVGTGLSIPFAFWLSGPSTGMTSLSRWLLLSHAAVLYYLIRGSFRQQSARTEQWIFGLILTGAVLSACYGIIDFLWPIPLPHPAADQFIWLEGTVLRRAQGLFHESSNFANFCGFFLIAASAAFLARKERYLGIPRLLLVLFISILSLGVLVSFSRSTWASVLTALFALLMLSRFVRLPRGVAVLCAVLVPLCLLWIFSPGLWDYLVSARVGRLFQIIDDPNSATSGRFDTWAQVISIIRDEPQYIFFGIGYKTLTVTRLFHGEIVTDNGYLSLLLESGLAGLAGFAVFSRAILGTFLRLARSAHEQPAFWATVIFSIWCGELIQLLATDAHTYWRNISIFTAMMALTLNLRDRADRSEGSP